MNCEKIIILETTIDHITGEEIGNALERLNDMSEILDAIYIPALGKKNRPCGVLQLLCKPADEDTAILALFRHTHALGIRRREIERYTLPRHTGCAEIGGRQVRAKIHELEGQCYMRPEADELARIAREQDVGMPALRWRTRK